MDLRIALGQRLSAGIFGTTLTDDIRRHLAASKIGNIILFRRNIESYEQLRQLCADLDGFIRDETGQRPFIMLDEECGAVSRLAHIAGCTPCAMAIGETGDEENARAIGQQIGRQLRAAGINFNLAPVVDCLAARKAMASGNRCFGSDPAAVVRMGTAYIRGLHESGILACSKHFPGAGSTEVDAHLALPVINRSLEELETFELIPFRAAIEAGTEAIMTAHIMLPKIEPQPVPSTLSRTIMTELLRKKLGFNGILVSDSLEMNAVMDMFPLDRSMTMAFNAGVDIALICHDLAASAEALTAQLQKFPEGTAEREACERSAARIMGYKQRIPEPAGGWEAFTAQAYHDRAAEILGQVIRVTLGDGQLTRPDGTTAFLGVKSARASNAGDDTEYRAAEILAAHFGGICWREIPDGCPQDCSGVVFIMEYSGQPENAGYAAFAECLLAAGIKVTVISMFTPAVLDEFPEAAVKICVWQYDPLSVECLIRLLEAQPARA